MNELVTGETAWRCVLAVGDRRPHCRSARRRAGVAVLTTHGALLSSRGSP